VVLSVAVEDFEESNLMVDVDVSVVCC
jgi:hypothetical protein